VKFTFRPIDPGRLGPLPPGLVPDGNAYEIRMAYHPSGAAITDVAAVGNIVLSTPEPASVLLFSVDGHKWATMDTHRIGGPDAVGGAFRQAGHYVAAIPGIARPRSETAGRLETARRILIVVLSVALVVSLARRVTERRHRMSPAATDHKDGNG